MPLETARNLVYHQLRIKEFLYVGRRKAMSKFVRKFVLLAVVLVMALGLVHAGPAKAQKTVVTWFVGLGTGTDATQIDVQNKIVENFNKSQDKIELKINIAASNQVAPPALGTLIASGNAPDIVGPVGFSGANLFSGQWLDLAPLVEKHKYDLTQFPESLVNLYREDGQLVGIPFAVFPGLIYVNKDLFDEAGLEYPPAKFDDAKTGVSKYMLDGKEVTWDWDTVAEVAKRLTVDANGKDATDPAFDPTKTEQFGFVHQWDTIRSDFSTFGGAPIVDANGKVALPEAWNEEAKWIQNGVHKEHFIPNTSYLNSDLLKPHAFASGKVAMARVMLWYTCCLADMKAKWDLAVMPSYKGQVYAPTDADTFRIHKDTKNPDAAFEVLSYLLGDGALDLITAYGAYPARPDLQEAAIKAKAEKYPTVQNWDLVAPSLDYTSAPGHEANFPNFNKGQLRFADFATLLYGDTGVDIDVDKEMAKLQADLQGIIEEEPAAMPTEAPPTAEATEAK
jgi:multiple sugar transport system substrate-binding protein